MRTCWAQSYSECEGKISREHLLSAGIFEQKEIYVQGFDWCMGEEKRISVASLTSKILCSKHNNALSDVDQAGIDAVRIFESTLPPSMRTMKSSNAPKYVDGYNFERWLLKTAINLSVGGKNHIGVGMSNSEPGKPSPYLLAVVFGRLKFTHEMGLYFFFQKEYKCRVGLFGVYPIIKNEEIGAFVFNLRGIDVLLSLFPGHAPPSLRNLGIKEDSGDNSYILDSTPSYRNPSLEVNNINEISHKIYFKW
jgi:hypothetical protein